MSMSNGRDERPMVYEENGKAVYRASALSCVTSMTLARMGVTPEPPQDFMEVAFQEGQDNEDDLIALVCRELEGEPYDQQLERELTVGSGIIIRGHIDTMVQRKSGEAGVVEVKLLGESLYRLFQRGGLAGMPEHYQRQMSFYTYTTAGVGWFAVALKRRVEGERTTIVDGSVLIERVETPIVPIATIKADVIKAEAAYRRGEVPVCTLLKYPCPYYRHHPEKDEPAWVEVDEDEFLVAVRLLYVARENARRAKVREDEAKAVIAKYREKHGDLLVSKGWKLSVSTVTVKERTLRASTQTRYNLDPPKGLAAAAG